MGCIHYLHYIIQESIWECSAFGVSANVKCKWKQSDINYYYYCSLQLLKILQSTQLMKSLPPKTVDSPAAEHGPSAIQHRRKYAALSLLPREHALLSPTVTVLAPAFSL